MTSFVAGLLVLRHVHSSYRDFWETLNENIKTYILSYSKHKRRDALRQKVLVTNRLIILAPSAFFLRSENQKFQKHFTSSVWDANGRQLFFSLSC